MSWNKPFRIKCDTNLSRIQPNSQQTMTVWTKRTYWCSIWTAKITRVSEGIEKPIIAPHSCKKLTIRLTGELYYVPKYMGFLKLVCAEDILFRRWREKKYCMYFARLDFCFVMQLLMFATCQPNKRMSALLLWRNQCLLVGRKCKSL